MTGISRLPKGAYSIADLARCEGICAKSARARLRKYFGGTLADLGISEWTYGAEDLDFVLSIIRPHASSLTRAMNGKAAEPTRPIAIDAPDCLSLDMSTHTRGLGGPDAN